MVAILTYYARMVECHHDFRSENRFILRGQEKLRLDQRVEVLPCVICLRNQHRNLRTGFPVAQGTPIQHPWIIGLASAHDIKGKHLSTLGIDQDRAVLIGMVVHETP